MTSKPPFLKLVLAIKGAILLCSHESAAARVPSCASLYRLGVMKENCGNVLLARSVANCEKGTMLAAWEGLLCTSEK